MSVIEMDDKELMLLTETAERAKSNTHQIKEIKDDVKEIKKEQKAIYELASSVKLIASDMSKMNESIEEVKQGQKDLTKKMDTQISDVKKQIRQVDEKSKVDLWGFIMSKVVPFLLYGGFIYALAEFIKGMN